jgi:murein DD-endopeptidase MepM/ murein hydrolase activator NlpD
MELREIIKKVLHEQGRGGAKPKSSTQSTTRSSSNTTTNSSNTKPLDVGYVNIPQDLIDAYGIDIVKQAYKSQGFEVTDDNKITGWGLPLPKQYMKAPSGLMAFGSQRSHGVHDGCDYWAPEGTPIYATKSGKVKYIETEEQGLNCGNGISIGLNNYSTTYCHMKNKPLLSKGEDVTIGQKIGEVGSTGHADGPHLHIKTKSTSGPFDNWSQVYSQLV